MPASAAGEAEARPGLLQNAARQFPVRIRPRSPQVLLCFLSAYVAGGQLRRPDPGDTMAVWANSGPTLCLTGDVLI